MSKKTNLSMCVVMFVFLLSMTCTAAGQIIYVDYNAPGPIHDGITWCSAYKYLQDALALAQPGNEIWVAKCSYRPDEDTAHPTGTGDRGASFGLKNDVVIYGGFPSPGDPNYPEWFGRDPNMLDRDPDKFVTTLSGDLSENDFQVADPCDLLNHPTRAENSYHVVVSSWNAPTAILDGFCITGGNAGVEGAGGGMSISFSNATVANCTFCRNSAYYGGGMYNVNWNYSPTLRNCTFNGNWANNSGAGMYNGESVPTLIECIFSDNSAGMQGGGMYNSGSSPTLTGCTFTDNSAREGGGIYNFTSSSVLINCKLSENLARASGGGICNNASTSKLGSSTFACNSAGHDGAGMSNWDNSSAELTNCILWDNTPPSEIYQEPGSIVTITYSDIRGGWTGEGNIDKDPCFVDCNGRLSSNSPCIDAGDSNAVPFDIWIDANESPRFVDDPNTIDSGVGTPPIVDMGAYEFQDDVFKRGECYPQTYSTYGAWLTLGKPNCWCGMYGNPRWPYQCDGDADNATQGLQKFRVYTNDFAILVANWKKIITDPTLNPCADFDHKPQGLVKFRVYTKDFNILVGNWKKTDEQLPDHCPRPE